MSIQITEAAAAKVKEIIASSADQLAEEGNTGTETRLRVAVKGGGCSGFSYVLDLTAENPGEYDEELEVHGVKVLVDQKSLLYLEGTVIDYVSEGPMREGFAFKNTKHHSCGCGSSFSV